MIYVNISYSCQLNQQSELKNQNMMQTEMVTISHTKTKSITKTQQLLSQVNQIGVVPQPREEDFNENSEAQKDVNICHRQINALVACQFMKKSIMIRLDEKTTVDQIL